MQTASRKVGEFLVNRKVLSKDVLEYALRKEADTGVPLAKILSSEGLVSERDLVAAVADQLALPFWDPTTTPVSPLVDGVIPADVARKHMVVGLALEGDALMVATDNPMDEATLNVVAQVTGWRALPCLAARSDIAGALAAMYGPSPATSAATFTTAEEGPAQLHVNQILSRLVEARGSDLHLTAGRPPMIRVDGSMRALDDFEELTPSKVRDLIYEILSQKLRERFESNLELDTSHVVPGVGRFRLNVFQQRDSVGAVLPGHPLQDRLAGGPRPAAGRAPVRRSAPRPRAGAPAPPVRASRPRWPSLIDIINTTKPLHIMTVEDPIEYLHHHKWPWSTSAKSARTPRASPTP